MFSTKALLFPIKVKATLLRVFFKQELTVSDVDAQELEGDEGAVRQVHNKFFLAQYCLRTAPLQTNTARPALRLTYG